MDYVYSNLATYSTSILHNTIKQASFGNLFDGLSGSGTTVTMHFTQALDVNQKDTLDTLVANHAATVTGTFDYQFEISRNTQESNIEFSRNLLNDWIRKNTLEGMNVTQSLWVFTRFENVELNFTFGTKKVDIFKMFYAGALPTAYYCLLRLQPDDMTQTYHWITQDRLNWVKSRMEAKLGAGMTAYLQSLP